MPVDNTTTSTMDTSRDTTENYELLFLIVKVGKAVGQIVLSSVLHLSFVVPEGRFLSRSCFLVGKGAG